MNAGDLDTYFVGKFQEISLSASSLESEIAFTSTPQGQSVSEEPTSFGPSAPIERFDVVGWRWNHDLEKVFYDTALKAADAVMDLHKDAVPFSGIQKAFSVGTMGQERGHRLVPTRWSITACDTIIGDRLLTAVKKQPGIGT